MAGAPELFVGLGLTFAPTALGAFAFPGLIF
jgi:hypothetical protein